MNEINAIFFLLLKAGAVSFFAGIVFCLALRKIGKGISPNLHRILWFGIILLGLCVFRIGITVPILPSTVKQETIIPHIPETEIETPISNDVPIIPQLTQQKFAEPQIAQPELAQPQPVLTPQKRIFITFILFALWIAGIIVLVIREMIFLWRIRQILKSSKRGVASQWETLLKQFAIDPQRIPLYWSENLGPALVNGVNGGQLLFPTPLWDELTPEQRDGVLRHELSHFLGRDSFWEFIARIFVLLQWFNPIAWFALKKFREATEWKCDDFAYFNRDTHEESAKEFIETILSVHESTESLGLYLPTFAKSDVLARIDRFVTPPNPEEKTLMKKILLTTLLLAFVFVTILDLNLVAQTDVKSETKKETQSDAAPKAQQKTANGVKSGEYKISEFDGKRVPKIIKMFPENNATDVDPNISQVYLTFDIPMGWGRAWASNTSDGTALDHDEEAGPVFWTADQFTCVAPVKLQPNKKYVVYMNIRPFIGFMSLAGIASDGLTYTFTTGPSPLDPKQREELAKNTFVRPPEMPRKKNWSPEQATGEPDAYRMSVGGDYYYAWASLTPDDQEEWIELTWNEPKMCIGVDIYETFNPGAVVKVVAYDPIVRGKFIEIATWSGTDPTPRNAKNGKGISKIRFEKPVETARIRIFLDSPNVPGWNEIDAVALVEPDDTIHWATGATASSTYADSRIRSRTKKIYESKAPFVQPKTLIPEEEEEWLINTKEKVNEKPKEPEPTWAAPEQQERVREVLRKMETANKYWFRGTPKSEVSSFSYTFCMKGEEPENISWDDIQKAQNWYSEFYRKGISYIGVSRLLLVDIDKLRCTRVEENTDKGTITFDFVLDQEWMNAVGNGISGSWKGWFNGTVGKGTATIDTKTNTLTEIKTQYYDEIFSDYAEIKPGQFVPKRIVVEKHNGNRDKKVPDMYFDFRFKVYEPGLWFFDKSVPHPSNETPNEPIVWTENLKINDKAAVEIR